MSRSAVRVRSSALQRGDAEGCGCLIGVAEGLHEAVGVPVYVYYEPDRSLYERTVGEARAVLGQATFEEARAEGRAMTFGQAVAYALGESTVAS